MKVGVLSCSQLVILIFCCSLFLTGVGADVSMIGDYRAYFGNLSSCPCLGSVCLLNLVCKKEVRVCKMVLRERWEWL